MTARDQSTICLGNAEKITGNSVNKAAPEMVKVKSKTCTCYRAAYMSQTHGQISGVAADWHGQIITNSHGHHVLSVLNCSKFCSSSCRESARSGSCKLASTSECSRCNYINSP